MKLLVVGSSQCAALKLAVDAGDNQFENVDFLSVPANFLFLADGDTGEVNPPQAFTEMAKRGEWLVIRTQPKILADDYDVVIYCSAGLRPNHPYDLVGDGVPHPLAEAAKQPLSSSAMSAMIADNPQTLHQGQTLESFRSAGFEGALLVEPWIRPAGLAAAVDIDSWQHYCKLEYKVISKMSAQSHATVLRYPTGHEFFTPTTHLQPPSVAYAAKPELAHIENPHGNAIHGRAVLAQVRDLLAAQQPDLAKKPAVSSD